ncbi:DUF6221 family protein [Streptomyces prunicolor]
MVEFLRARLDADERRALAAPNGPWEPALVTRGSGFDEWAIYGELGATSRWNKAKAAEEQLSQRRMIAGPGYEGGGVQGEAAAQHIARHNPTRVLAEVAAKRELIRMWESLKLLNEDGGYADAFGAASRAIQLHAAVHSGHPDYLKEWAP